MILDVGAEEPAVQLCTDDILPQTPRQLIYGTDQDLRAAKADVLGEGLR